MRRTALVLSLLVSVGWIASHLAAQEAPETAKPKQARKKQPRSRPKREKPLLRGEYAIMAAACELSQDQQKRIADMLAMREKELAEPNEKVKAAAAERVKAKTSRDKEAMEKATARWRAAVAERTKLWKQWSRDILGVLTPEQQAKWHEFTVMRQIKRQFAGAEFTPEQLDRIKSAYVELSTGVDMDDDKARRQAMARLTARIREQILTEDQKLAVALNIVKRPYRKVKLTEDQAQRIKAAYLEFVAGVDPKEPKARGAAMKKLSDHIMQQILTDEQREAMKRKPARAKASGGEAKTKPRPTPTTMPASQ